MRGDCNICINGKLPSYSASCVECGLLRKNYKPITNADRIRAMTDEELAFWMTTNVTCCSCPVDLDACHNFEISGELSCEEILLNWLKAPVEVQDGT